MAETDIEELVQLHSNKYFNEFVQERKLAQGSFGTVWKVEEKSTSKVYAIKTLLLLEPKKIKNALREIKFISKLKSEFTVEFINVWREKEDEEDFVYIQMEMCKGNLTDLLPVKPDSFGRDQEERINSLEYFISWHLLRELTECLNYLHSLTPPIMHRDLNPGNILITEGQNGRFIKICDFGLSKDYLMSSNTSNLGTGKYVAWEVKGNRHYNYQADIFSLAVISLELFGFEFEIGQETIKCLELSSKYLGTNLEEKINKLLAELAFCVAKDTPYKERPTCAQFLRNTDEWTIDKKIVLNDKDYQNNLQSLYNYNNKFFTDYSKSKLFI